MKDYSLENLRGNFILHYDVDKKNRKINVYYSGIKKPMIFDHSAELEASILRQMREQVEIGKKNHSGIARGVEIFKKCAVFAGLSLVATLASLGIATALNVVNVPLVILIGSMSLSTILNSAVAFMEAKNVSLKKDLEKNIQFLDNEANLRKFVATNGKTMVDNLFNGVSHNTEKAFGHVTKGKDIPTHITFDLNRVDQVSGADLDTLISNAEILNKIIDDQNESESEKPFVRERH